MSTPASPSDPKAATPAQSSSGHTAEHFAEALQIFWLKYANSLYAICIAVVVGILGYGAYRWYAERQELGIEKEYASVGDNLQRLQEFAAAHSGHSLAGVAMLKIADENYASAKYADAQAAYEKSLAELGGGPFAPRVKLGLAMSQLLGGKVAEGEASLKQIAADTAVFKGIRAEAAFHLLTRAVDAGKSDEAAKLVEQILQVEPSGLWAQRAIMLRATLGTVSASPSAAPARADGASGIKLNVPGN